MMLARQERLITELDNGNAEPSKSVAYGARLVDLTTNQNVEEEWAEFETNELSDANLALLREGAVFRWVIGYQRAPSDTKRRVSDIVFRRLPAWTKKDLLEAKTRATSLVKDIVWD